MLDWLIGKKKRKEELPIYSELKSVPTRGLPPELAALFHDVVQLGRRGISCAVPCF